MIGVELCSNGAYWQASWYDSTGKRRRKSIGAKAKLSRRAALAECRKLAATHAVQPGARDAGGAPRLSDWEPQFFAHRTDLDDLTCRLYRQTFARLLSGHGILPDARMDTVTRQQAAKWRAWLQTQQTPQGQPLAVSTVRKHVRNAKVIFGEAQRLDLIPLNPFDREVGAAPALDNDWHFVSDAEMARLLDACPDARWRCLFALCRWAGLRLGEAHRLRWSDISWDQRTLTVRPAKGHESTKQRRRVVPIEPRLYTLLLETHEAAEAGATRVVDLPAGNLHRAADMILSREGLSWSKTFHTLRKNRETEWLAIHPIMDVCRWLGHAPTVAAQHYHQTTAETMSAVTGASSNTELDALRSEVTILRRRVRRVIAIAKKVRTT